MYNRGAFFWDRLENEILLTNDFGRFAFLTDAEFSAYLSGNLAEGEPLFARLEQLGFLYTCDMHDYAQRWAGELATMKECAFSATQLFILVLTNQCNQSCVYCQAGANRKPVHMSKETCRRAIDLAAQSPASRVTIEFQGGEPTLNADALRFAVSYAKQRFAQLGKRVDFAIATNMLDLDEALMRWLIREDVHISTSLDGPEALHDANRPLASGSGSYQRWQRGIERYRQLLAESGSSEAPSAIQTTTRRSLPRAREIVDAYLRQGIHHLYVRPLTPLGCAAQRWAEIGYTAEEYLEFYRALLEDLMKRCLSGTYVCETTAAIYLRRILLNESVGHTEHRSPCGGAIGQMAINFDGKVYTCDEARMLANMGDELFLLGTVDESYNRLISSPAARAVCTASCIEVLPHCRDCVFVPYCSTCPVVTYGLEGDLVSHKVESYRCKISKGILRYLFSIIQRNIPEDMKILRQWAEEG